MKYLLPVIFLLFCSCVNIDHQKIVGLWELQEVTVDVIPKEVQATYLKINADQSFAIARRSGDISGIYTFGPKSIAFVSEDVRWFNTKWKMSYIDGNLILTGVAFKYRGTKLRFQQVTNVPDFQEFENKLIGDWQIYSTQQNDNWQPLKDTWFRIDENGNYAILDSSGLLEQGQVAINTRHKKIIFESDSTIWNAWFYGPELRLDNTEFGLHYSLRRYDE